MTKLIALLVFAHLAQAQAGIEVISEEKPRIINICMAYDDKNLKGVCESQRKELTQCGYEVVTLDDDQVTLTSLRELQNSKFNNGTVVFITSHGGYRTAEELKNESKNEENATGSISKVLSEMAEDELRPKSEKNVAKKKYVLGSHKRLLDGRELIDALKGKKNFQVWMESCFSMGCLGSEGKTNLGVAGPCRDNQLCYMFEPFSKDVIKLLCDLQGNRELWNKYADAKGDIGPNALNNRACEISKKVPLKMVEYFDLTQAGAQADMNKFIATSKANKLAVSQEELGMKVSLSYQFENGEKYSEHFGFFKSEKDLMNEVSSKWPGPDGWPKSCTENYNSDKILAIDPIPTKRLNCELLKKPGNFVKVTASSSTEFIAQHCTPLSPFSEEPTIKQSPFFTDFYLYRKANAPYMQTNNNNSVKSNQRKATPTNGDTHSVIPQVQQSK